MKNTEKAIFILFVLFIATSMLFSSCAPGSTSTAPKTSTRIPTATPSPLSSLTLKPGEFYFRLNGTQSMIFARNPTGYTPEDFSLLLDWARQGGTKLLRIHLTVGWNIDAFPWSTTTGAVNEAWAQKYDRLFDQAEADGIWILPVFSAWFNWNNGAPDLSVGADWKYNPYNQAKGGPFKHPGELFLPDSPMQKAWMGWVKTLVERWQGRKNIFGWEILSEINNATGAPGKTGVNGAVSASMAEDFTNRLAAMIRAADTKHRPVTVSGPYHPLGSSGADKAWANFYDLEALDFVEVHPYNSHLDREIISEVRDTLRLHNKAVLIGESGLDAFSEIRTPSAKIGVQHAIWAGVVSGAANARAFWNYDGWDFYGFDRPQAVEYMKVYAVTELPAARFTEGVDFSGFKPLTSRSSLSVWGAAVGNESMVLGWFRDAASEPPNWTVRTIPAGQTVTITIPGTAANWQVDFYDTKIGTKVIKSIFTARNGNTIIVTLPDITDDIALKMYPSNKTVLPTESTSIAASSTDLIAGKWTGMLSSDTGGFSTPIALTIKSGCKLGTVCGTVSVPKVPCTGNLFFKEIQGDVLVFVEQNMKGASACSSGGFESLQLQANGTLSLKFTSTSAQGATLSSSGILKK
jgi:hypothetical protein